MASNNTVSRIFNILDLIANSKAHLTGAEISKKLEIPSSTTHDILKALLEENVVYYKDYKAKTYAIGIRVYALSKNYFYDSNIITVSKVVIKEICDKYSLSGYVLKPIHENMIVTYKYESFDSIIKIPDVGYEFDRSIYKAKGVYYNNTDIHCEVSSIIVPIFDYTEKAIGEIAILGLTSSVRNVKKILDEELLRSSTTISTTLGSKK